LEVRAVRLNRLFLTLFTVSLAACHGTDAISSPEFSPKLLSASLVPTSKGDCFKGGWTTYGFKNQGQCVRFIETGKDSRQVPPIPTEGLVAWYPFNGNANDETGNGWDGTVVNATLISDRFGVANSAYSFNGVDSQIEIWGFDFAPTTTRDASVSVWVNIRGLGHFVSRYYNLDASRSNFSFYQTPADNLVRTTGAGVDFFEFENSATGWTHMVAVYKGTAGTVEVYRNGVLVSGGPLTYNSQTSPDTPVLFGRVFGPIPGFLDGDLDDVRLYDIALTPSMIQAIYDGEK
jgi:hypothetical protein